MSTNGRSKGVKQLVSQREFIDAYNACTGNTLAFHNTLVANFGVSAKAATATYQRVKRYKAKGLIALDSGNLVESGQILTKTSTYHYGDKETGKPAQWIQSNVPLSNQLDAFRSAVSDAITDIKPVEPVIAPTIIDSDLTTFYPLPDLHFGLLIRGDESSHGQSWDSTIATRWVIGSMDYLVDTASPSKYAVITDLGDFLHAEDNAARTKSGHQLDTDGRHSKIVKASFDIIVSLIDKALTKHEVVYFYSVAGNHSENSSIYLKAFLSAWYRKEPRVVIYDPHKAQQYHIFGKNIIGFTHGHELKPAKAAEVLVADNQSTFSASEYRYFHFGHFHSNHITEGALCTTEIHKNITPQDKWADSAGYRGSIGYAKSITYHVEYGEIARSVFNIKMLDGA